EEGVEAFWAGDYEQAHTKLERAYQLFSVPTLALWSARARVRVGQWVEAAERYREVARPSSSVDAATQQSAQAEAKQELSELTPRIPSLTVQVHDAQLAEVQISLDDAAMPTALIGVPRPTNPGKHKLVAVRGAEHHEREVELIEGQREVVAFELAAPLSAAP